MRLIHDRRHGTLATGGHRRCRVFVPAGVVAISVRPSKTAPPDGLPRDAPHQCVFQPRVLTFQAHPLTLDAGSFGLLSFKLAPRP
jgi:hypothetical protein